MTLEFAIKEAKRRTDVLGTTHYVYPSTMSSMDDQYIVTARELRNGFAPVQTYYADGSELES